MLVPIPALNDNYIWLYRRENFPVIVIDIPEITHLIPYLESNKLDVEAVLLTHNHDDHVQGVAEFKQYYPNVPVFGPTECANKGATNIVDSGVINTAHYHHDYGLITPLLRLTYSILNTELNGLFLGYSSP